jgi:hypothetical protein
LKLLDPGYPRKNVMTAHISRLRHPHPVYSPGFPSVLAPVETSIDQGTTDRWHLLLFSDDRDISDSLHFGKLTAEREA